MIYDAPELFMDEPDDDQDGPGDELMAAEPDIPIGLLAQIAIECNKFGKHVSEFYFPKRVTGTAAKIGLNPGFASDLNENDPLDGKPWNFNDGETC